MLTSQRRPVKPDWQVQTKALSMSVQEPKNKIEKACHQNVCVVLDPL